MDPLGPLKYMILGPLKFKKTKKKDGTTKVHESRRGTHGLQWTQKTCVP